jgi:DNA-binding IclR family transcriptional regulator
MTARTHAIDMAVLDSIPRIRSVYDRCTVSQLAEATGYPRSTVGRRLLALARMGEVTTGPYGAIRLSGDRPRSTGTSRRRGSGRRPATG